MSARSVETQAKRAKASAAQLTPDVRRRWIQALLSGEYEQTQAELRTISGDGHCCLGVLCDVEDPEGWSPRGYHRGCGGTPDVEFLKGLGVKGGEMEGFPILNDAHNWTFAQIADLIESTLPGEPTS